MAAAVVHPNDAPSHSNDAGVVAPSGDATAGSTKHSHKSFRRKYRKIRHEFEQVMKKNELLFKQERQCEDAIRRIAEENDLLLDLLLDVNSSVDIPKEHRITLGSPDKPLQASEQASEENSGQADLTALLKTQPIIDKASLVSPLTDDLAASLTMYRPDSTAPPKDRSHRNSVSVYNWLRRNQPQVFLQDGEETKSKKDSLTPTSTSTKHLKRASIVTKNSEDTSNDTIMDMASPPPATLPQTPAAQTNGTLKRKRRQSTPEESIIDDEDLRAYSGYGTLASGSKRKRVDDGSASSSHISALVERERERERATRAAKLAEQGIVPGSRGRARQANGF